MRGLCVTASPNAASVWTKPLLSLSLRSSRLPGAEGITRPAARQAWGIGVNPVRFGRNLRLAALTKARSRWVLIAFTLALTVVAFAGPYNLPGPWKGAVPALGVVIVAVREWYDKRGPQGHVAAIRATGRKRAREQGRAQLLAGVQREWVKKFGTTGSLGVSLDYQLRPVPMDIYHRPISSGSSSPAGTPAGFSNIDAAFEEAGGHLLLLGAGGSGKTWMLVSLAGRLHDAAKTDSHAKIPVVLRLADWRSQYSDSEFVDWVIREMANRYSIPAELSRRWLDNYELALLLDGLDEVAEDDRRECSSGIKKFLASYGVNSVLVTSRTIPGEDPAAELNLGSAVEIVPLSIDSLAASGSLPQPISELSESDLKDWARELLDTPLMVSVASVALSQLTTEQLRTTPKNVRRSLIFDAYVTTAIDKPRSIGLAGHSAPRFLQYLTSFAILLVRLHLTAFAWSDLTSAALPGRLCRWVTMGVPGLAGAGVGALASLWVSPWWATALGLGVSLILIPDAPNFEWDNLDRRDRVITTCAVLLAVGEAVAVSKIGGVRGLALVVLPLTPLVLGPWTEKRDRDNFAFCAIGIGTGFAGVAVFSAHFTSNLLANIAIGAGSMILCCPLLSWLAFRFGGVADFGFLLTPVLVPASGIFLVLALAVRQSPAAVIPVGLGALAPLVLWSGMQFDYEEARKGDGVSRSLPLVSLGAMLTIPIVNDWRAVPLVALLGSMIYISFYLRRPYDGAPLLKRPIIHAWLASQKEIPWRFRPFADSAVERMLLRRVGERYVFWHPLLQEHIYQKPIH